MQHGPRANAITVHLMHGQFLSTQRTATAVSELFGAPVSAATVTAATTRAAAGLTAFLEGVRAGPPVALGSLSRVLSTSAGAAA